jgi:hypothetical protein
MSGGLGIGISVGVNTSGELAVEMTQTDHTEAAKNSRDILPPEIKQRLSEARPSKTLRYKTR